MSILSSVGSGQHLTAQKELAKIYKEDSHVRFRVETISGKVIATLWNDKGFIDARNNPINVDALELPCPIKFDGTPRVQFFFFTEEYQFKNIPTKEELEKQTSQYIFQGASFHPKMILDAYNFREHIQYSNIYLPEVLIEDGSLKPFVQELKDRGIDTARFIKRLVANNNTVYILEEGIPDFNMFRQYDMAPIIPMEYKSIKEGETDSRIWAQYISRCDEQEQKLMGFQLKAPKFNSIHLQSH